MTFDNILNIHGKVQEGIVLNRLTRISDKIYGKGKWEFNHSYDSEAIASFSGDNYNVEIGEKALYDNCTEFECNKAAYVLLVKDMYHEQRHVWQDTVAWNDDSALNTVASYRQTTDMIRRKFVREYFPSAYENNYSNDPSEMDAEWYGIKMTLAHFESDPIVSKAEANEILYQMITSENCVHREMLEQYKDRLGSIQDVLDIFEERRQSSASISYSVTEPDFLHAGRFKEYRDAFSKCRTGVEQDKVLEQAILFAYPDSIKRAPLRLRDELKGCMRQMELNTFKEGPHAVPPKRISYSTKGMQEMVELTEEDVAGIPADNDVHAAL